MSRVLIGVTTQCQLKMVQGAHEQAEADWSKWSIFGRQVPDALAQCPSIELRGCDIVAKQWPSSVFVQSFMSLLCITEEL